ncbi:Tudor domain-containing protein 3 [Sciurus carolinensis]|uniref:Tudor domain-containing protein 3 n=1 Tax=Sciurus carolinensis TaxID=30640 RepID=A0AA41T703_SCICA|nr:Tudor domain-containing protein 3 [Sciurus carolinensis]
MAALASKCVGKWGAAARGVDVVSWRSWRPDAVGLAGVLEFRLIRRHLKHITEVDFSKETSSRVRSEDEEDLGNGRPSAPSTLYDFLESKMGTLYVEGVLDTKS